jgi:hypothetical protein
MQENEDAHRAATYGAMRLGSRYNDVSISTSAWRALTAFVACQRGDFCVLAPVQAVQFTG